MEIKEDDAYINMILESMRQNYYLDDDTIEFIKINLKAAIGNSKRKKDKIIIKDKNEDTTYTATFEIDPNKMKKIVQPLKYEFGNSIDHPKHYNHGGFETIDKIKMLLSHDEYIGFLKGNAIKYLDRADYKGHKEEDLEKMNWYLKRLGKEE